MAQPVTRGRRLEPDARREQILDCAVRRFGERPYAEVSTTGIAQDAGVARGLLNHYFGTKRELYLEVVRRLVALPEEPAPGVAQGPVADRVAASVEWFLDSMGRTGPVFAAVTGSADADVEHILDEADTRAARAVLSMVGLPTGDAAHVATIRSYGALAKAAAREWTTRGTLTREQARVLLVEALLTVVHDVLPALHRAGPTREDHP